MRGKVIGTAGRQELCRCRRHHHHNPVYNVVAQDAVPLIFTELRPLLTHVCATEFDLRKDKCEIAIML